MWPGQVYTVADMGETDTIIEYLLFTYQEFYISTFFVDLPSSYSTFYLKFEQYIQCFIIIWAAFTKIYVFGVHLIFFIRILQHLYTKIEIINMQVCKLINLKFGSQ